MKRVMCVWFPNWPIQRRLAGRRADRALVVYSTTKSKPWVVACSRLARERGVLPGMLLAEAQALWPASSRRVHFEEHDPLADRQALRELAVFCQQFSPQVAIDSAEEPDSLFIDATGLEVFPSPPGLNLGSPTRSEGDAFPSPPCFDGGEGRARGKDCPEESSAPSPCPLPRSGGEGKKIRPCFASGSQDCGGEGERKFAQAVGGALDKRGYRPTVVIADTIGAAWGMAHYGRPESRKMVIPHGQHAEVLRALPLEALRLPTPIIEVLHQLNIFHIHQLLALPRAELPSRFGVEILQHIDRAFGTLPEMVKPEPLAEPLEASLEFEYPIGDGRALTAVVEHLLDWILEKIDLDHFGIQHLDCSLKLVGEEPLRLPIALLRPTAAKRDLMELASLKIERLRLSTEIAEVTLRAAAVRPLEFQQDEMFGGQQEQSLTNREVTGLIERLSTRLGEKAILYPQVQPDPQPELAWSSRSRRRERNTPLTRRASEGPNKNPRSRVGLTGSYRPAFLQNRPTPIDVVSVVPGGSPKQVHWEKRDLVIERSWGPERIETGWWRGDDIRRDYFLVESEAGEQLWVFRNLVDDSWYLHGVLA